MPLKETVRSFKEIIEGKHDDLPEQAFAYKGGIDDVVAAVKASRGESAEAAVLEATPEAAPEAAPAGAAA